MARRKTTELVKPHVRQGQYGREGDNDVTFLSDFGFTKKQWNRRTQELKVTEDEITAYFDECIALGWHPSLFGLWKFKNGLFEPIQKATWSLRHTRAESA